MTRQLKQALKGLLQQAPLEKALAEIRRLPARQAVNPLFSFLYSTDPLFKWRAVTAMGEVVFHLSQTDMESARIIIRRLMWNLNDESGGIGWGSAEAMGEIMARNGRIAAEYASILSAYIQPEGNYLETPGLQHGALWGIGRVAHAHTGMMDGAAPFLIAFMTGGDKLSQGLAAWAAGPIRSEILKSPLSRLTGNTETAEIFIDRAIRKEIIGNLATAALKQLQKR